MELFVRCLRAPKCCWTWPQSSARLNATGGGTSDLALLVLKAPPHVSPYTSGGSVSAVETLEGWQLHASSASTMAPNNSLTAWQHEDGHFLTEYE